MNKRKSGSDFSIRTAFSFICFDLLDCLLGAQAATGSQTIYRQNYNRADDSHHKTH
jgi:hypothetical protein